MKPRIMVTAALLAAFVLPVAGDAGPIAPRWASLDSATIRPGAQTFSPSGQCTANFVFYDARHVYIGQAAHCTGTGSSTDTNGCTAAVLPEKVRVAIDGASRTGTVVYNSWVRMQAAGERNANTCFNNDFALVRIAKADRTKVNPTVPHWGGPRGLAGATSLGDPVYSYGNSGLWLGIGQLKPHQGISIGTTDAGWSHSIYSVPPGIPGDSGSAYLDGRGRALGLLSTLEFTPVAGSNNVTSLRLALRYLRQHSNLRIKLAHGTQPFAGLLPTL